MDWTVILSYAGLLIFLKTFYMLMVGLLFVISNGITTSAKYFRIALSSFLIWLSVSYVWEWINGSAMPVLAFIILSFLMSLQLVAPNFKEVKAHARSEIVGLMACSLYVYGAMGLNWY